ncbi:unnamed protein product [Prorocentrum cordatum]|uniref:Uncharacterized protein n=1 Tax=Prorocentrum cordatum TaxID=2364126 RepID=A0ABN9RB66_9DINO|nr:unnamed protein product [Polarella glacialis]
MQAALAEVLVRETLHWVGLAQVLASSRCPEAPACPPIPSCPALPEIPSCPACPGAPPPPARPSAPAISGGWAVPLAAFSLGGLLVALVVWAVGRWGMAALTAPALALVLCTVAGPAGYHQRRVLGCRRAVRSATELDRVLFGAPDLDVYEESYRTGTLGVAADRLWAGADVAAGGAGGPIPAYEFVPFEAVAGVMAELVAAAGPAAQGAGAGPARPPGPIAAGPAPGAAPALEPAAAVGPAPPVSVAVQAGGSGPPSRVAAIPYGLSVVIPASGGTPWGWSWRAQEDLAVLVTCGRAMDVGAPGGPPLGGGAGRRAVALLPSGRSVFVARVADTEVDHLKREWVGSDALSLPVVDTAVNRERARASVISDCREEDIPDFGVKVPRSVKWCAAYQPRTGGPIWHSEMRGTHRWLDSDFGVTEHETLGKVVEMFETVAPLDLCIWAGVEVDYRELQLLKYYRDERRQGQQRANARRPLGDVQAFLGRGRAASMGCPELLHPVSRELEVIAGIKNNAMKLREELAALAKQAGLLRDLVQTLNQVGAGEHQLRRQPLATPRHIQELALAHLASCCAELGGPPLELTADAALRELQVSPAYGAEEPQTLAPLTFDLVSLPKAGAVARPLEELLRPDGPDFVRAFLDSKVLPSRLAAERKAEAKFPKPYLDPCLRERARRSEFTHRLLEAGVLDLVPESVEAREEVGLSTAWKKNGSQRLVETVVEAMSILRIPSTWISLLLPACLQSRFLEGRIGGCQA